MLHRIKKLNIKFDEGAKMPTYAHSEDACMDIYSNEDIILKVNEYKVIKTGVYMDVPKGWEIQVRSKSGLAAKHGVFVLNAPGIIDAGYTGEFGVILKNSGYEDYEIKRGDKIAQLALAPVYKMKLKLTNELKKTNNECLLEFDNLYAKRL